MSQNDALDTTHNVLELELWYRYKKAVDEQKREFYRKELVTKYAYLVDYVVNRFDTVLSTVRPVSDNDDLKSSGIIGLMDAIEKFEIERGIQFNTYALTRIRGEILDELRRLDHAPRSVRDKLRQIELVRQEVENQLGRKATTNELADAHGISVEEFCRLENNHTNITSLHSKMIVDEENDVELIDLIGDDKIPSPEKTHRLGKENKFVYQAISKLSDRLKQVILAYYFEEKTLAQIGKDLNVCESRVSQMHTSAMRKLEKISSALLQKHAASYHYLKTDPVETKTFLEKKLMQLNCEKGEHMKNVGKCILCRENDAYSRGLCIQKCYGRYSGLQGKLGKMTPEEFIVCYNKIVAKTGSDKINKHAIAKCYNLIKDSAEERAEIAPNALDAMKKSQPKLVLVLAQAMRLVKLVKQKSKTKRPGHTNGEGQSQRKKNTKILIPRPLMTLTITAMSVP